MRHESAVTLALALVTLVAGCQPKSADRAAKTAPAPERGTPRPAMPGKNVPAIKVDTVGYPVNWRKLLVFNVSPSGGVVETESGEVVLSIRPESISDRGEDRASGDRVYQVDVSELRTPGRYRARVGAVVSDVFAVFDGGYDQALLLAQKHFYFQRTRTALTLPFARFEGDDYVRRGTCHAHGEVGWDLTDYPEKKRRFSLEGGWHDAGNYDMYVPSTAPTVQELLLAYEWAPSRFVDGALGIPESGNGTPDLLDEARVGLRWVLSMQEADSGAFRHREAVMEWSPPVAPDEDTTTRWVAGPSSAATAKAVAALALAARIYEPHDAAFADRCRNAAQLGWRFLEEHPEHVRVDGKGSPQPLWDDEPGRSDQPARFVAAVEYHRSFGDAAALERVEAGLAQSFTQPDEFVRGSWANLSRLGLASLTRDEGAPEHVRVEAKARLLSVAERWKRRVEEEDGYRSATALDGYYWGSNANLTEKGYMLLVAYALSGERWMLEAARDQWHWLLGRNPNGFSMITRVGRGPERIYHMEWGKRSPPPPGYLVGGPNHQDMNMLSPNAPAKALLWDAPFALRSGLPEGSLWHQDQTDLWDAGFVPEGQWDSGWWAVTEPDIYYNASLVLFATYLDRARAE